MTPPRLDPRQALRWTLPPVVAWMVSSLVTWWVARAVDVGYWSTGGRERWDSTHYLSIARGGYEMFRCWDAPGYREAGFPDVICGNVAWFPGYPMLVRAVAHVGLSFDTAAVLVSEGALLAMFLVLWWLIGGRLTWASGLTLALGTVFVGGVYFHAAFPIALGTLALLVSVAGIKRENWFLAAGGGFVAASCHLVGAVVVGMLALSVFYAWTKDAPRLRVVKGLGAALVAAGGVVWAMWLMWRATGAWDAYQQINRSSYGQGGLKNPFAEMRASYDFPFGELHRPDGELSWLVEHSLSAHQAQLWVNTAFVLIVLGFTGWRFVRDRRLEPEEWACVLLLGAIFVVPFVAGATMSWYRNHAQLFVALVLVARLPRWVQWPLLTAFAVQYVFLSAMFFAGVLV